MPLSFYRFVAINFALASENMFGPRQADWERLAGSFFTWLKCTLLNNRSYGIPLLLVITTFRSQRRSTVRAYASALCKCSDIRVR